MEVDVCPKLKIHLFDAVSVRMEPRLSQPIVYLITFTENRKPSLHMIRMAPEDGLGPVELFQEHQAGQFVGQGQAGQG